MSSQKNMRNEMRMRIYQNGSGHIICKQGLQILKSVGDQKDEIQTTCTEIEKAVV
jgi:predicted RNA-binding protein YlqC (UPF0109 family)